MLAECLLFYKKVRVVAASVAFQTLIRTCGAEELLHLCDMGCLEIEYLDNLTGIVTIDTNIGPCHDSVILSATSTRLPQIARKMAQEEAGGSGKRANKLFDRFNKIIQRSEYDKEITSGSKADLVNQEYLQEAIRNILPILVPEFPVPDGLIFCPQTMPKVGIHYETNLDFVEINRIYHQTISPKESSITPAYLLARITGATPDIIIASRNTSEFAVDPIKSAVVASRFSELIKKVSAGKESLESFKEVIIDDSRSIREAVNSGERNFREVIRLVESAEKFKEWIQKHENGEHLRAEYCRSVSHAGWAESLASKVD